MKGSGTDTFPADRTLVTSVDMLEAWVADDGRFGREKGTEQLKDMQAAQGQTEAMLRQWLGLRSAGTRFALFQSMYKPGQFCDVSPDVPTMCTEGSSDRRVMLPGEVLEGLQDDEFFPKDCNSLFDYEPFIEALREWYAELRMSEGPEDQFFEHRLKNGPDPRTCLYIVLTGITGTTCIAESVRDSFKRMLMQEWIDYQLLIPRNVVASRTARSSDEDRLFEIWSHPDAVGVRTYDDWRDIQIVDS